MSTTIQEELYSVLKKYEKNIAIEYGEKTISYEELNQNSDKIKWMFIQNGIKQNQMIGIFFKNRIHIIETIIAVLKAGCIFVPLDETYQNKRLKSMVDSVGLKYIVTDEENLERAGELLDGSQEGILNISGYDKIETRTDEIYEFKPDDPVYIFFTSGSTGKPKAILGKNESILHFANWEKNFLQLGEQLRVSQVTSPGFDAILRDIFTPLCSGGTICIPENRETILDGDRLQTWIEKSEVNVIHCTPTLFRLIADVEEGTLRYPKLKYILMAGERIAPQLLKKWYKRIGDRIQLVNLYGPSETTMVKAFYSIQKEDCDKKSIPVGRAMEGAKLHILDSQLKECNTGEEGEIWIETEYMSLGYYLNEELTNEKFRMVTLDEIPKKMYQTGDYGRFLPDGNVDYIGRKDRQIKLRGNRVELEEIEANLLQYPDIKDCVVNVVQEDEKEAHFCKKCGLTIKYDGVTLDENGVCNVCHEYEERIEVIEEYFRPMEELKEKITQKQGEGKYDCLLLYSGGKDSTYVLYKLVEMGIRVLPFVFDNGYISETAIENIHSVVDELNIECVIQTQDNMNQVFREGLKEECSVCLGCFKVLNVLSTLYAYEHGIPYIINGLSRGQIFDVRLYDIFQQGKQLDVKAIEEKIWEQRCLYHAKKDYVTSILGEKMLLGKEILEKTEVIDFYRYTDVKKAEIMEFLKQKSALWSIPKDTGSCSSNCKVNDVGIYVQRKRKEYDNYTFPNSWEVRLGHITLEQSKHELEIDVDEEKVQTLLNEIGYEAEEKENIIAYYVADKEIDENDVFSFLNERLPGYEVPSEIIQIEIIPVTVNGKTDYEKLPKSGYKQKKKVVVYRDEVELSLAGIWSEILGTDQFNREDNFLAIGGHSLKVMQLVNKIQEHFSVEIPLEVIFNDARICAIADYIKHNASQGFCEIEEAEEKEFYRLSSKQFGIYLEEQISNVRTGNNIASVIRIYGEVEPKKMEAAIQKLIERYDILRTKYEIREGDIAQVVEPHVPFELKIVQDEEYDILDYIQKFDLTQAPLLRAVLFQSKKETRLLLDVHHIATDGLSTFLMMNDIAALYDDEELDYVDLQYKDYVAWEKEYDSTIDTETMKDYWKGVFTNYSPYNNRIAEYQMGQEEIYVGNDIDEVITDNSLLNAINQLAFRNKTTMFVVYYSAFSILYAKYAAAEDVTIGTPLHGRVIGELMNMPGIFAIGVAMRSYPKGEKSFITYLNEVKEVVIQAMKNQQYTIGNIVKDMTDERYVEADYLFDTIFTMFNLEEERVHGESLEYEWEDDKTHIEKQKLRTIVSVYPDKTKIKMKYATEYFEQSTIQKMIADYITILKAISENEQIKIADISLDFDMKTSVADDNFENFDFNF